MCENNDSRFNPINFIITFFTRKLRPKSLRVLFAQIFALLLSLFILSFLITSFYFSKVMRDQLYTSIQNSLTIQNSAISQNFEEALVYLSENCMSNSDISSLNTTDDSSEVYLSSLRIKKTLSLGTNTLANIGGLFVYSDAKDVFIPQTNDSWDHLLNIKEVNRQCSHLIRDMLRESKQDGSLETLNTKNWFLLTDENNYFLVRILKSRNTYAGAWTRLDYLASAFESVNEMDAILLYTDENGNVIGNSEYSDLIINPQDSLDSPSYYTLNRTKRYIAVSTKLDYCEYYITVLIPHDYLSSELSWLYTLIGLIFFILFLFSAALTAMITHFFNTPSAILNPVIQSLRRGEFNAKIEMEQDFQEIRNITDTFNDMIGEIQQLRIDIYEEQLINKELELQYLKSQVAPHFLINCLNTIFVLSQEPTSGNTAHALIKTLSDHLRYTLASRTDITLDEEIYHVKNYLHLTQLRFPGTLTYDIQIEPSINQAKVFPLILLMLTENSVKINVVMGEDFQVVIRGYLYEKENQQRIHLIHIDSGKGFREDYLDIYNHILDHPEIQQKGKSIGLYNTAMRLRHVFGDSACITFSNEPDMGARIDIDFPYILYLQEDSQK